MGIVVTENGVQCDEWPNFISIFVQKKLKKLKQIEILKKKSIVTFETNRMVLLCFLL